MDIHCNISSVKLILLLSFHPELLAFKYNKCCRTSFPVGKWPFEKQSTDLYLRHFEHCPYISVFHSTALWSLHVKTFFTNIDFLRLVIWCTSLHS